MQGRTREPTELVTPRQTTCAVGRQPHTPNGPKAPEHRERYVRTETDKWPHVTSETSTIDSHKYRKRLWRMSRNHSFRFFSGHGRTLLPHWHDDRRADTAPGASRRPDARPGPEPAGAGVYRSYQRRPVTPRRQGRTAFPPPMTGAAEVAGASSAVGVPVARRCEAAAEDESGLLFHLAGHRPPPTDGVTRPAGAGLVCRLDLLGDTRPRCCPTWRDQSRSIPHQRIPRRPVQKGSSPGRSAASRIRIGDELLVGVLFRWGPFPRPRPPPTERTRRDPL